MSRLRNLGAGVKLAGLVAGMVLAMGQAQAQDGGAKKGDTPRPGTTVAAPPPVPALPSPESFGPPDANRIALGRKLASLLNGEAVTRIQLEKLLTQTLPQQMRQDPGLAAAEQKFPGLIKHVIDAMRPMMARHLQETLPRLIVAIGDLYARDLDADALEEALEFYQSDTGAAVIQSVAQEGDLGALVKNAQASSGQISADAVKDTMVGNAAGAIATLSQTDRSELLRFAFSRSGRLLARANLQVASIVTVISNAQTVSHRAEFEEVGRKSAIEYITQYQAAHGEGAKDKAPPAAPASQAAPHSKDKPAG